MTRKLILFGAALVLVLGAFGLYWMFIHGNGNGTTQAQTPEAQNLANMQPNAESPVVISEKTALGEANRASVPLYDNDSRKNTGLIQFAKHRPLGRGQFHLTKPQIWRHFRNGMSLYIESDTAVVEGSESAQIGKLNPKSGRLIGNVYLMIDRNPSKVPPQERPGDLIRIYFNEDKDKDGIDDAELEFDYPDNLIQSASEMTLQTKEVDIRKSHGLTLRWDLVNKQITQFRLNTRSELAGGADLTPAEMHLRNAELAKFIGQDKEASKPAGQATPVSGSPAGSADASVDVKELQYYIANFHKNVQIVQGYNEKRKQDFTGKLFSDDQVRVIFDFFPPDSDEMKDKPAAEKTADAEPAGQRVAKVEHAEDETRTLIQWEGVLDMVPYELVDEQTRLVSGLKRELVAIGSGKPGAANVVLLQSNGRSAICQKLHYDVQAEEAQLFGDRDATLDNAQQQQAQSADKGPMVVLTQPDGNKIESRLIVLDLKDGRARGGAGTMLARNRGGKADGVVLNPDDKALELTHNDPDVVSIQWEQHIEIAGGRSWNFMPVAQDGNPDGTKPGAGDPDRDFIREANFTGKVKMRQLGQYEIEAHAITVYFHEPSDKIQPNQIDYVEAVGRQTPTKQFDSQVKIIREGSEITCDRLELKMKLMPGGLTVPDKMIARGNVKADQAGNIIEAEQMELKFDRKPDTPDGKRADVNDYEAREVQAFGKAGGVVIRNEQRGLHARGDHLYSIIGTDKATLTGQPASITLGDRSVSGAIIELNQQQQFARVLGAGTLAFVSDRDLTGAASNQPVPIQASWTMGMSFDSANDVAELRGDVHARTTGNSLRADLLKLYFKEKPKEPDRSAGAAPTAVAPAAVSASTATQPAGSSVEQPAGPVTVAGAPATQPDEDPLMQTLGGKQLVRMVAERNVVAINSTNDPQNGRLLTRLSITAEQLIFNALTTQVDANGHGQLLMEDYRLPSKPAAGEQPANTGSPLTGGGPQMQTRQVRPSRTAFEWQRSMKFNPSAQLATFAGDVRMAHIGPAGLKLGPDGGIIEVPGVPRTFLNCQNLLVHFVAEQTSGAGGLMERGEQVRDIRNLVADGQVRLKEGKAEMTGDRIEYLKVTDTMTARGNEAQPARFFQINKDGAALSRYEGKQVRWNRTTGEIDVEQARFVGQGG